jgi:ribosomal protein S12 methylthiotransferase
MVSLGCPQGAGRFRAHPHPPARRWLCHERRLCRGRRGAGQHLRLPRFSAKEESLAAIGEAIAENGRVIVTGCMGEEADAIRARFPQVLAVTGAHQYEAVVEAVHEAAPPTPGPVRRPDPAARRQADPAPLQLSQDFRGLQPRLRLLHHPAAARQARQPPDRCRAARGGKAGRRGHEGTAGHQPGHLAYGVDIRHEERDCGRAIPSAPT